MYAGYRDLNVYRLAYKLTIEIFQKTKSFPVEEKYSLTDQIRRASRSIPANLAEAWRKRLYSKMFVSKLADCAGEASEVEVWLDISKDAGYLSSEDHQYFINSYGEVNKMLNGMMEKPERFCFKQY